MTTAVSSITAEELFRLPPDNMRHELVRGEMTTMAPTSAEHGASAFNMGGILRNYLKKNPIGVGAGAETGFLIQRKPDTVRAPDCAFVSKDRIPATGIPKKYWPFAPDLAVEVLSPSDTASEVIEKIDEWLGAGTRLVWVVDPDKKTITVYRPGRQPQTLRIHEVLVDDEVLPGFEVSVAEIFG
jgi:Uma2 family endonuclease